MILESLIASIVVGIIRGGKLKRLSYVRFKAIWIFILALLIQGAIIYFGLNDITLVTQYTKELYIASYILLFIGIIMNLNYKSLWTIFIGGVLNLAVFIVNGGKVPISIDSLKLAGLDSFIDVVENGKLALYTPITDATKYAFLGDIITIPQPYPYPQILSIGDVFIALGLFLFIQSVMLNKGLERRGMTRYKYKYRR